MGIRKRTAGELASDRNLCGGVAAAAGGLAALAQVVAVPGAVQVVLLAIAALAALAGCWFHLLERRMVRQGQGAPPAVVPVIPRTDMNKPMKFVNRHTELELLDRVLERAELGEGPLVAVLEGLPGVGKSAVGRYWASLVQERFTDGDLVADFSERRRGGAVDVSDFLADFIRQLSPPGTVVPTTLKELDKRFEAMTFGRKLLVLLDDVSDAAQVNQLRPAGKESLVIATSYRSMEELYYHGAELVPVDLLTPERAQELLVKMAGAFGSEFEEHLEQTRELVRYCAGLALPLCVCASRLLAGRGSRSVASILAAVADEQERLEYLEGTGEYEGAAVFGFAYKDLTQNERLTYRRVSIHPGPDIAVVHAAVLTGLAVSDSRDQLDGLSDSHLLGPLVDGRYRFHDLVRLHARECAEREELETSREQALSRLVDWYRACLRRADHAIVPERLRIAEDVPIEVDHVLEFAGRDEAFDWLETERSNILAVLESASHREWDDRVWQMVESLWLFFYNRRHYLDWIDATKLGIAAARRAGHRDAEIRLRTQLAWAYAELGSYAEAHGQLDRANRYVLSSDNLQLRGSVREFTGTCYLKEGNYGCALEALLEARQIFVRLEKDRAIALQDYFIGWALLEMGEHAVALESLRPALDTMRRVRDDTFIGRVRLRVGQATFQLGDAKHAQPVLEAALATFQRLGMPVEEAEAYEQLAAVAESRGDEKAAAACRERAQAIYKAMGYFGAEIATRDSTIRPLAV